MWCVQWSRAPDHPDSHFTFSAMSTSLSQHSLASKGEGQAPADDCSNPCRSMTGIVILNVRSLGVCTGEYFLHYGFLSQGISISPEKLPPFLAGVTARSTVLRFLDGGLWKPDRALHRPVTKALVSSPLPHHLRWARQGEFHGRDQAFKINTKI